MVISETAEMWVFSSWLVAAHIPLKSLTFYYSGSGEGSHPVGLEPHISVPRATALRLSSGWAQFAFMNNGAP